MSGDVNAMAIAPDQELPAVQLTYEGGLWLLIAGLAMLTRVWYLDAAPLTNGEATNSLAALAVLRGDSISVLNPLFTGIQSLVLSLFGANDFGARLPATIAGTILCVLPLFLRDSLGRGRALVFGALLAVSPSIWFLGRQADGSLLAWVIMFAAWLCWRLKSMRGAVLCVGLLLANGQDAVGPMILLVATIAENVITRCAGNAFRVSWTDGVMGATVFVIASTSGLWRFSGLGDAFNGFTTWWQLLTVPGALGLGRIIAGLAIYEPLLLLAAIASLALLAIRRHLTADNVTYVLWLVAGVVLLVVKQDHSPSDLFPVLVGSAALAAYSVTELLRSLASEPVNPWRSEAIVAALSAIMFAYGYLGLMMYAVQHQTAWLASILLALVMVAGIGVIATLTLDAHVAVRGIAASALLCLFLYTLSTGYQLTQTRATNPAEPYVVEASSPGLPLLIQTVETISMRAYGDPHSLPLQVADTAPPALRWALRDQLQVTFVARVGDAVAALTPINGRPASSGVYIGNAQRVTASVALGMLRCRSDSNAVDPLDCTPLARWFTQRAVDETTVTRWILWLRSDLALKSSGQR